MCATDIFTLEGVDYLICSDLYSKMILDPQLALLALWATLIDAKLPSPAELLYQCQLRTTIPAKICNTDPAALQVCAWIDSCSDAFQGTGRYTLQTSCTPVCWSAPCHVGHPLQDLDFCYSGTHPTQGQLPSMHQWWHGLLLHEMTPMWMQCQAHWHCPRHYNQPHCRLLPDLTCLHHSLHPPNLHNWHSLCQLHLQHLWLQSQKPQLSPPCQLSQRLPWHLCLWHPTQPLCSQGGSGHAHIAPKHLIQEM